MKTSVVVVAHNEEKNIEKCLRSIVRQKPDELVVICHNCTDRTVEIAKQFQEARVVVYKCPKGVVYAKMKGFEEASNEYVACIDGDSWAFPGWVKRITKPLVNKKIAAVGGVVLFFNSWKASLIGFGFFVLRPIFDKNFKFYFWGANFACRKSDYGKVGGLKKLKKVREKAGLKYFWTFDLYLSLLLEKRGKIVPAKSAIVFAEAKNMSNDGKNRWKINNDNRTKMFDYFGIDKRYY